MTDKILQMQNFLQNMGYNDAKIPDNDEKRIYLLNIKNIDDEIQISEKALELGLVFVKEQKPHYKSIEPLSREPFSGIEGFIKTYYIKSGDIE